jgi:hypothetical protein
MLRDILKKLWCGTKLILVSMKEVIIFYIKKKSQISYANERRRKKKKTG